MTRAQPASLTDIPDRPLPNGRHPSGLRIRSEFNPINAVSTTESAPTTTAAEISPAFIMSRARPSATAPDADAELTNNDGPPMPRAEAALFTIEGPSADHPAAQPSLRAPLKLFPAFSVLATSSPTLSSTV